MSPSSDEEKAREVTRLLLELLERLGLVDVVRVTRDGRPVYRFNARGKGLLEYLRTHEEIEP